jgi:hypothetical protein
MQTCLYCDEPITSADRTDPHIHPPAHWECAARAVIGGLNHQQGKCLCCGGTEPPDPPGMSRRQAAKAALEWFQAHRSTVR